MRKKQTLLIITTLLCTLVLSSSLALAVGGHQVKIPYVVSGDGWWTGIAITNHSSDPITDMKLSFTTKGGNSMSGMIMEPFNTATPEVLPFIFYTTNLDEIAGKAMLVGLLTDLYTGDGTKTLPSDMGSVILSHTGDAEFSAAVFVGGPDGGFAYQVSESTPTGL